MADIRASGLTRQSFQKDQAQGPFYSSPYIGRIIAEIVQGTMARKGLMVLSGNAGVGKTTIIHQILKSLEKNGVQTVLLANPAIPGVDLIRKINRGLGAADSPVSPIAQLGVYLRQYSDFLKAQCDNGKNCAIIIDDAQNLDPRDLALLHLICDMDARMEKRVQYILVGRAALVTKLNGFVMGQIKRLIAIRKILRPLSREEMRAYIQMKLGAGGDNDGIQMTRPAMRCLYRCTHGNCQQLDLFMARCLGRICRHGGNTVTRKHVRLAHTDLYPEKYQSRIRALVASLAALSAAVMASWMLHLQVGRSSMAAEINTVHHYKIPQILEQDVLPDPLRSRAGEAAIKNGSSAGIADPALTAFLSVYQLDEYYHDFRRALESGRFESVARRIYAESGYQLVQLPAVPDSIRRHYGALAFSVAAGRSPHWLLFWRPQIKLKRFYCDYRGAEIIQLQTLLADSNLYHYKLDGIVGPRLINAVLSFQRASELPMTGFPDAVTLFWLCHQQAQTIQWKRA